ncbi:MAG TPA: hypothetical protein VK187_04700, partial [Geobacteraceae bacterium]|nr:hypothetical protein [Geobacteraceae bacterium]
CIVLQAISLFEVLAYPQKIRSQDVSRYENKFKLLQNKLPAQGVFGFVSDCPDINEDPSAKMFSAQYALSPRIIVNSADTRLVVVHSCSETTAELAHVKFGLIPHIDLGNGVMLFRKETE